MNCDRKDCRACKKKNAMFAVRTKTGRTIFYCSNCPFVYEGKKKTKDRLRLIL